MDYSEFLKDIEERDELKKYRFEIGPIRPPSEGGCCSLLIRITYNCPWSRCKFCYGTPYGGEKFRKRGVGEIIEDILSVKNIENVIKRLIIKLGSINRVGRIITPFFLYEKRFDELNDAEYKNIRSIINVYEWMYSGEKTVFLQDANSLVMNSKDLATVLRYIKKQFPQVERVTSYARSSTLSRKSLNDLIMLKKSGLDRLHVGLESGDDDVLKYVNKGVTAKEHIIGGVKAKEAKIELSEYIMPGLGGKKLSVQHAKNTARVISEINPDYVRSRPYTPNPLTPLYEEMVNGEFEILTPYGYLDETKILVKNLNFDGRLCFDHMMNFWRKKDGRPLFSRNYEGYNFPDEKDKVLALIDEGLSIDESIHEHKLEYLA
ncbi:MAG TPA: radical SAM protein [Halobacteria archaeon]|nr:radical SAM protein [Halobacteria archaeon]